MTSIPSLQPTLWRTCRVLANRTRLAILDFLFQKPGQTVSAVAARFNISLPIASQYLRALEARGLLSARRAGRRVKYRPPANAAGPASRLGASLRLIFQRSPHPAETVFKLATAFTHPRRIEIFRRLYHRPCTLSELQAATRISTPALARHLRKLKARGFVTSCDSLYAVGMPADTLGRELARLAANND